MKLPILLAAGAVALTGLAAPAQAQYYDRYDNGYRHDGYRDGYRYDRDDYRHDRRYEEWRREHGWRGGHWRDGYRGRPRVACRIVRGWYGPERRCFRVR